MAITVLGIDLGKNSCSVLGLEETRAVGLAPVADEGRRCSARRCRLPGTVRQTSC